MKKLPLLLLFLSSVALAAASLTELKSTKGSDDRGEFEINYLQLTPEFKDEKVRADVNKQLRELGESYICEANPEDHANMSSNLTMEASYASPSLLGVSYSTDYFCNGAYPDHTPMGHIFSLRSGKELEIEDEVKDPAAFKRFVVGEVRANTPKIDGDNKDCADLYAEDFLSDTTFVYVLTPGKLQVSPDYPHVAQGCGFNVNIPLKGVKALLKKESDLNFAE